MVVQLGVDTGDAVRAVGDDADVVFDEDDGDPLVVQLVEEGVEGVARLGVDADGRLVERE